MPKVKTDHQINQCDVSSVMVTSPIGDMQIVACQNGLHLVKQCDPDDKTFLPNESHMVHMKSQNGCQSNPTIDEVVEWLKNYFHYHVASQDIPKMCPTIYSKGTFRYRAWTILPKTVPYGKKISYLQLATLCGNSKACRAAGSAMSTNPISLLIPCHRVIPSSGAVGNYSGGKKNSIKSWLLNFEQGVRWNYSKEKE